MDKDKVLPLSYRIPRLFIPCSLQWFAFNLLVHRQYQWTLITIQFRPQKKKKQHWTFMFHGAAWGESQPVLELQSCRRLIYSMAIHNGKVKREPCSVWASTWSRAKTISSLAVVFTPISSLEVYQDSATASLNQFTVIHEAMATWLWVWAPHCHLAKLGRFCFLNCSSETKLAQPPLVILVILPLNCLHFVSLFLAMTGKIKLSSHHSFKTTN